MANGGCDCLGWLNLITSDSYPLNIMHFPGPIIAIFGIAHFNSAIAPCFLAAYPNTSLTKLPSLEFRVQGFQVGDLWINALVPTMDLSTIAISLKVVVLIN